MRLWAEKKQMLLFGCGDHNTPAARSGPTSAWRKRRNPKADFVRRTKNFLEIHFIIDFSVRLMYINIIRLTFNDVNGATAQQRNFGEEMRDLR